MTKPIEEYSDFELNKAIAETLGFKVRGTSQTGVWVRGLVPDGVKPDSTHIDYCNSWNDLMPLVVEYGIQFFESRTSGDWYATKYLSEDIKSSDCIQVRSKNPKRALAECLLKVLETKKDD